MRFSKLFITTLKEVPVDAQVISHQLMFRAGLIIRSGAGLYAYSPLFLKSIEKLSTIIRHELNKIGCLEIILPMVTPAELWQESNRLTEMDGLLTSFQDRSNRELCLSPTNEESVVDYFRKNARSYKQLPTTLYQINTKFRDEIRPRFGLMRAREFTMKDAYSFHVSKDCLDKTYQLMFDAYQAILNQCELNFIVVEADGGAMAGGDQKTHEFQILAENGEDEVVVCKKEEYGANIEAAVTKRLPMDFLKSDQTVEKIKTPNIKTIEDVCNHLNILQTHALKSMLYTIVKNKKTKMVMVVTLGDDKINDIKLKKGLQAEALFLSSDEDIKQLNLNKGFLGPVNLPIELDIIVDEAVDITASFVVGANDKGFHLKHVCPKRDFKFKQIDVRLAKKDDVTPSGNPIEFKKGIEVGHIFQLGDKYTRCMKASVLDENGKAVFPLMGCYGIGVGRLLAAAIEQNNDEKGIVWPESIAPFKVIIISTTQKDDDIVNCSEELYQKCLNKDIDAIYDDRSISAGIKFKDADLIGFPIQIIIGKKWKEDKEIELKYRKNNEVVVGDLDAIINKLLE